MTKGFSIYMTRQGDTDEDWQQSKTDRYTKAGDWE